MGAYDCDCMENILSERKNRLDNGNCSEEPNNSGLQKCPFCDGEARLIRNARRKIYGKDEYRVGVVACCNVCEAKMFYGSEKLAIEAWNRRSGGI